MKYTFAAAREFEDRGIGLLASASYVLGNLDDNLLSELEQQDFQKMTWLPATELIVINGPNGKLVIRFGNLDQSGTFLRFKVVLKKPCYASIALLRATLHDPIEFVSQHLSNPIRRAHKVAKDVELIGLLIGDETKHYSSLLSVEPGRIISTDIEPRVAGGAGKEATVIKAVEGEESEKTRESIRALLTNARLLPHSPYTTNVQVAFASDPKP
jgi:hypothetical protein